MIYLDHAATSYPKPGAVIDTMLRVMRESGGNPGRSAHPLALSAASAVYRVRETAASFFHASEPEQVLFFPNATYALNTVLHGICRPERGKQMHVLISELEHNAVVRPLHAMAENGVVYETYPVLRGADGMRSDAEIVRGIRERIRQDTGLICACHMSNVCGAVLPVRMIGELCAAAGIPFLVDASQSAGVYDLDMVRDRIGYLCTAGHKALLGPQGSGLLLIGDGMKIPASLVQGGNGVASLSPEMPDFLPEALEAGTLSVPCIAGLGEGIRTVSEYGLADIRETAFSVYRRLLLLLSELPGVRVLQSGISCGTTLSFVSDRMSCSAIAEGLSAHGICVRSGYHCAPLVHRTLGTGQSGTVRMSVGFGSRTEDADQAVRVLRELLQ